MYFRHEKHALVTVYKWIKETCAFHRHCHHLAQAEQNQDSSAQAHWNLSAFLWRPIINAWCFLILSYIHITCSAYRNTCTGLTVSCLFSSPAVLQRRNEQFLFSPVKKWGWRSPSGDTSGKDRLQEDSEPTSWRGGVVAPHRQHEQG